MNPVTVAVPAGVLKMALSSLRLSHVVFVPSPPPESVFQLP